MSRAPTIALLLLTVAASIAAGPEPVLGQSQYQPWETVEGPAAAVSGDTVLVGGSNVRLYGIDAPELGQICYSRSGRAYDCGASARDFLNRALGDRTISCTLYAHALTGEQVGRCSAGSTDIGQFVVGHGWAFSARGLSNRYDEAEALAQARGAGVWSGRAVRPWVWRQQQDVQSPDRR